MSTVRGIAEKFLWCRDVLHSWDPYDGYFRRNKKSNIKEVHTVLICTRCGTYKTRRMTEQGVRLKNDSYKYPPGYLLTEQGALTPADRATLRRINLKQQFPPIREKP